MVSWLRRNKNQTGILANFIVEPTSFAEEDDDEEEEDDEFSRGGDMDSSINRMVSEWRCRGRRQ